MMACEYCKGDEYIIDDHGIKTYIEDIGDGCRCLTMSVTISLASQGTSFFTRTRIDNCPMCGEKLGGDA